MIITGPYTGFGFARPVKPKVFVSYHHKQDQPYYDAFSRAFHETSDIIYDNSLDREIDSDDIDYVITRIRENYITGTSCTIVLIGKETWGRKYVDWEIKATLDKEHGLIGVRLPTAPLTHNNTVTVPGRLYDNVASGFALWLTWQQITTKPEQLQQYINESNKRDKRLINNRRDRRLRNG